MAEFAGMILDEEIEFLPRGINLRAELFQLAFLMLEALFDVVERSFQVRGIAGT